MINFVVCDDEDMFIKQSKSIISKCMMAYDIEYKIRIFNGYGPKFENYVKHSTDFNIYLLDIKTEEGSGINAARMIREKYDDWSSMIMIITSYSEYKYEALTNRLMLVDFINKLDKCEEQLISALKIALKNYDHRPKMLTYEYNRVVNRINLKDIIYIEKEQDSKRCMVHTDKRDYTIPQNLNTLEKTLDKRFLKVHRSLIVNIDHLQRIEPAENKMLFKNGEHSYLLSRGKKRELIDYVGNHK